MSAITFANALGGFNDLTLNAPDVTWTFAGPLRVTGWRTQDRDALQTLDDPGTYFTVDVVEGMTRVTFSPSRLEGRDRCFSYQIDVERFAGDSDLDAMFRLPSCEVLMPGFPPMTAQSQVPEVGTLLMVVVGLVMIWKWRMHWRGSQTVNSAS